MRVQWTSRAENDRLEIFDFICAENPDAAFRMDDVFDAAAARLADFPNRGRIGEIAGTREIFPHENYRLVYEIEADTVWILALIHAARAWPPAPD